MTLLCVNTTQKNYKYFWCLNGISFQKLSSFKFVNVVYTFLIGSEKQLFITLTKTWSKLFLNHVKHLNQYPWNVYAFVQPGKTTGTFDVSMVSIRWSKLTFHFQKLSSFKIVNVLMIFRILLTFEWDQHDNQKWNLIFKNYRPSSL